MLKGSGSIGFSEAEKERVMENKLNSEVFIVCCQISIMILRSLNGTVYPFGVYLCLCCLTPFRAVSPSRFTVKSES
jgi:hypothetical protein